MYICIYVYMYIYGVVSKARNPFFPRFGNVNVSKIISPVERVPFTMEVFSISRAESACAQYGARNGLVEGALGSNEKNSSHRFA